MSFLVDTDICSAFLKGDHGVWQRCMQYAGRLHVSAMTVGELYTWALRSQAPPKRLRILVDFLKDVTVLEVTTEVAQKFGEIRAGLLDAGRSAPQIDLMIAATALTHGLTLVTHNTQDFLHVPGLTIIDWLNP